MIVMDSTPATRLASAIQRRFGESMEVPTDLPGADALAQMNERSVCRRYRPDAVPKALLRILCATALSSPSKSDLQQASIIRVSFPADRGAIQALLPGSPWIAGAPEFLVICGDGARLRRIFFRRGLGFPNDDLEAFFNVTVDGAIVLSTLVQAAGLIGLGCCPISEIRNHAKAIAKMLVLPDWVFPIAGLTLGWSTEFEPLSPRLALTASVHDGRYDATAVDRELDDYDARRIRDRPYPRQRDPKRFGVADRYGGTEDKARQCMETPAHGFGSFVRLQKYQLD